MHVHLVVVTEYRCDEFIMEILDDMRGIFSGVCRDFEAERAEFDDEDDHVYLLVDYQPKVASERIQGRLKSHDPTEVLLQHSQKKLWSGALWSRSYFAGSSGGAPIEIVRKYIEQQKSPPLAAGKDAYGFRAILPRPEG
ncbi:IS200/IS605 family transposase [Burkholderia sp. AU30198]|uniref:IS200/IS605 family transposase n=1 Tax=Burkholderia sp. AU30198 TaxID=2879627 RepID=UPI0039A4E602